VCKPDGSGYDACVCQNGTGGSGAGAGPSQICSPGTEVFCANCPTYFTGYQTCKNDGSGYGACDCRCVPEQVGYCDCGDGKPFGGTQKCNPDAHSYGACTCIGSGTGGAGGCSGFCSVLTKIPVSTDDDSCFPSDSCSWCPSECGYQDTPHAYLCPKKGKPKGKSGCVQSYSAPSATAVCCAD
jgi:hypothetical protein